MRAMWLCVGEIMYEDEWCIEEEKKYIFGGSAEIFLYDDVAKLHAEICESLSGFFNSLVGNETRDYIKNKVLSIIDKKFGPHL